MRRRKQGYKALIAGGLLLLAAAFLLTGYNLLDTRRAGLASQQAAEELKAVIPAASADTVEPPDPEPAEETPSADDTEVEIPDYILNPDMEMPEIEIDGSAYIGLLEVPDLDLSLPVMSQWSYDNLRLSPCRYSGSAYSGGLVIAGHNYRTHFGPLDRLSPGAAVVFTDADGNRFTYEVSETEVLQPSDVPILMDDQWDLTLFTCTLDGQARFTVRCTLT